MNKSLNKSDVVEVEAATQTSCPSVPLQSSVLSPYYDGPATATGWWLYGRRLDARKLLPGPWRSGDGTLTLDTLIVPSFITLII